MDGTGKTTQAQYVANILTEWGYDSILIWSPDFFLIRYPIALIRRIKGFNKDSQENPLLTRGGKPKHLRLFPYLALLDNWVFYIIRIKPHLVRGRAIVCDRYFYNFFLSFEYYGYSSSQTSAFCTRYLPRPDISYVLDCDPEIAWNREKDRSHDLEFFHAQRERYRSLAQRLKFYLIDTNQPMKTSTEQIRILLENEFPH